MDIMELYSVQLQLRDGYPGTAYTLIRSDLYPDNRGGLHECLGLFPDPLEPHKEPRQNGHGTYDADRQCVIQDVHGYLPSDTGTHP